MEVWEGIVKRNADVTGNNDYLVYLKLIKSYYKLLAEEAYVKGALLKLFHKFDKDLAIDLQKMGYPIVITDSAAYAKSLVYCAKKSENLKSKIKMKENELLIFQKQNEEAIENKSFEQIMGNLIGLLGFHVPDDITLARYNEFRLQIIEKIKAASKK